jgi:hypothetical protein
MHFPANGNYPFSQSSGLFISFLQWENAIWEGNVGSEKDIFEVTCNYA